ncbi:ATP-binding protein [Flavihumibacter fluvii]|nr:ATP-binding protein [Flavihumibacter fluvii]
MIIKTCKVISGRDSINDPTLADAIMDRMTAGAIRIELKGESLRRKK